MRSEPAHLVITRMHSRLLPTALDDQPLVAGSITRT